MSEYQKDKSSNKPFTRQPRVSSRRQINQSAQSKTSIRVTQINQEITSSQNLVESYSTSNFSINIQQILNRLSKCSKNDVDVMIKDGQILHNLRAQQKRISKLNVQKQADYQLSLQALINLISYTQSLTNPDKQKSPQKSSIRINQQKDINRQLNIIDQYIENNNFASIKVPIQNLLKKYSNDQILQGKMKYLKFILGLTEDYEKQMSLIKDVIVYVQKMSGIDTQNLMQSNLTLKNMKKEATMFLNKQSKKSEPNQKMINLISQVDKINNNLLSWIQSRLDKKQIKSKKELQLQKQLQQKSKTFQLLQQPHNFYKDLLGKNKQEVFKQLENIRKNKKKSSQIAYSILLKLYDVYLNQKKQINDINTYLKSWSQLYTKKAISNETILNDAKKLAEKYNENQSLSIIKSNLDLIIFNLIERERSIRQSSPLQLQLKRLKLQILTLEKQFEDERNKAKNINSPEKIKKDIQEKQEKDIQQILKNILHLISQRNWNSAKTAINTLVRKYQQHQSIMVNMLKQTLITQLTVIRQFETIQTRVIQFEKKQKNMKNLKQPKDKQMQEYETTINTLLQKMYQKQFDFQSYFESIRKNPKKMNEQKYKLILQLEVPLLSWKQKMQLLQTTQMLHENNLQEQYENIKAQYNSLSISLQKQQQRTHQLQSQLKESNNKNLQIKRDVDQLLGVVRRIDKGTGQWWKPLPKSHKTSILKQVYPLLQIYRQNQLAFQRTIVNEDLLKQQLQTTNNAINLSISFITSATTWISEQDWTKKLHDFKGVASCDKIILCLKQLTKTANMKIEEERNHYVSSTKAYQQEIQNLTNIINQLQRQNKQIRLSESSSKKSMEQKSRVKRRNSIQKNSHVKIKIQQFIEQQKSMLTKIQQLSQQKYNLQTNTFAIQNQLARSERKIEDFKTDLEQAKIQHEKDIFNYQQRISQLEQKLQENQKIKKDLQVKLQNQKASFDQMEEELRRQLHLLQWKDHQNYEQMKKRQENYRINIENSQSHQLKIYQQMYGDLTKELQTYKQKERLIKQQYEHLKQTTKSLIQSSKYIVQSNQHSSNMNMDHLKFNFNSNKVVDIYLDQESPQNKKQKQHIQPIKKQHKLQEQIESLRHQLARIQHQKAKQIQKQVNLALFNQQVNFNNFLQQFQAEKLDQFMRNILPSKLQQELSRKIPRKNEQQSLELNKKHKEQEINAKIELSLQKFKQQIVPIMIRQQRKLWEEQTIKQWSRKAYQIEFSWKQIIQKYKVEHNTLLSQLSVYQQKIKQLQNILQNQQSINKQTQYKIVNQILGQWEKNKAKEWDEKQQKLIQFWQSKILTQNSQSQIIQRWKINNLNQIIEQQRKLTIQNFINFQLPQILLQQRSNWDTNIYLPNVNKILLQEYQKWQQAKNHEIKLINSRLESKIDQILHNQHSKWQKLKNVEILQVIEKQRTQVTVVEEKILQENYQLWQIQKNKQIQGLKLNFQQHTNQIQLRLNQQIDQLQKNQKNRIQQAKVIAVEKWRKNQLLILIQNERKNWHNEFISKQLPSIINKEYQRWEEAASIQNLQERQKSQAEKLKYVQKEYQYKSELNKKEQEWKNQRQLILKNIKAQQMQWQMQKTSQWDTKVKQIEKYWQEILILQRNNTVENIVKEKVIQVENFYHQQAIPNILQAERKKWQIETQDILRKQKISWESSVTSRIKAESAKDFTEIQAKNNKIASLSQILEEYRRKCQFSETQIIKIQQQYQTQKQQYENQMQQIIKYKQIIKELDELKKIKQTQKIQISKLQQQLNENTNKHNEALQKKHNYIKEFLVESKNTSNSPQRHSPITNYTQRQMSDQEANLSYERQIAILISIIKTKDNQISFLKKTIDAANAQLRQNHQKLKKQLQMQGNNDKLLAEIKHSHLQLQYEIKYLKDNERNLIKQIQLKQQQIKNLYQKKKQENASTQNHNSSYQSKYIQMQNMFNLKAKQFRMLYSDAEHLKQQNQHLINTIQLLISQKQALSLQVEQLQHYIGHFKQSNLQQNRPSFQKNKLKIKFGYQIMKGHQQITQIQHDEKVINQTYKQRKSQNMHALKITNNSTNDLTIKNNQVSTKCFISQNKETSNLSLGNFTSLIQKHTDSLISYLLKQEIIPNLKLYHRFIAQSMPFLKAGNVEIYLALWQKCIGSLFNLSLESRASEIKTQAQELLKLRDQMTQIIQRQIQASQGDQSILIEDYKGILEEVKSLVLQYLNTEDKKYLRLLCDSLGI